LNTCVWMTIFTPVFCFFYFTAAKLWVVAPYLLFVVAVVLLWTIVSLVSVGWSDPGIIPRQTVEDAIRIAREWSGDNSISSDRKPPDTISRLVDGSTVAYRYCKTCHVYKPPRASHCSDCDNCVLEFDHHCPFVANCIGQRNYGAFNAFLFSVVALIISVLAGVFASNSDGQSSSTTNTVFIVILVAFSAIMFFVIFGFSVFHCCLVCKGKTTKEQLKGIQTGENAQRTVACCSRPRSLLLLRSFAEPHNEAFIPSGVANTTDTTSGGALPVATGQQHLAMVRAEDSV